MQATRAASEGVEGRPRGGEQGLFRVIQDPGAQKVNIPKSESRGSDLLPPVSVTLPCSVEIGRAHV